MSQALTDRTGYTCLHAVYSIAAHECDSLLFSFCGNQISAVSKSPHHPALSAGRAPTPDHLTSLVPTLRDGTDSTREPETFLFALAPVLSFCQFFFLCVYGEEPTC